MRIELACFTDRGQALGTLLAHKLAEAGDAAHLERCGGDVPLRKWVAERFHQVDALVFIGAVGIAVRAVAPAMVSKISDPAVVAVDDGGRYAIALLSGHIGGANELAGKIAGLIGAEAVVTTATDRRGLFAIDTWARRNGLAIVNPERIKTVSARLLAGKSVTVRTPFPLAGPLPDGLVLSGAAADVVIDIRPPPDGAALLLVPPVAVLGVGCRKGTAAETIDDAFAEFCESTGFCPAAFGKVCTIDIKVNESGLLVFCERRRLPLETFGAERLMREPGTFTASAFVASVTGADNVCERSAVAGGGGRLAARKTVIDGVALAAAVRDYVVRFDDDGKQA